MDWDRLAKGQLKPLLYLVTSKLRPLFGKNRILLKKTTADSKNSSFRSIGTQFTKAH